MRAGRPRFNSRRRQDLFLHNVEASSGVHPASYTINTGGYFLGGIGAWGVKLTTRLQLQPRSSLRGSIHPLPHTSSWSGAYLIKHRDKFIFFPPFYRGHLLWTLDIEIPTETLSFTASISRSDCSYLRFCVSFPWEPYSDKPMNIYLLKLFTCRQCLCMTEMRNA
jgi:hypothetical protein